MQSHELVNNLSKGYRKIAIKSNFILNDVSFFEQVNRLENKMAGPSSSTSSPSRVSNSGVQQITIKVEKTDDEFVSPCRPIHGRRMNNDAQMVPSINCKSLQKVPDLSGLGKHIFFSREVFCHKNPFTCNQPCNFLLTERFSFLKDHRFLHYYPHSHSYSKYYHKVTHQTVVILLPFNNANVSCNQYHINLHQNNQDQA